MNELMRDRINSFICSESTAEDAIVDDAIRNGVGIDDVGITPEDDRVADEVEDYAQHDNVETTESPADNYFYDADEDPADDEDEEDEVTIVVDSGIEDEEEPEDFFTQEAATLNRGAIFETYEEKIARLGAAVDIAFEAVDTALGEAYILDYIMEAEGNTDNGGKTAKPSILQKVVAFIMGILEKIGTAFSRVKNFFKGLFGGNKKKLEQLEKDYKTLHAAYERIKGESSSKDATISDLQAKNKSLTDTNSDLNQKLGHERSVSSNTDAALKASLDRNDELDAANKQKDKEISDLKATNQSLKSDLDSIKQKLINFMDFKFYYLKTPPKRNIQGQNYTIYVAYLIDSVANKIYKAGNNIFDTLYRSFVKETSADTSSQQDIIDKILSPKFKKYIGKDTGITIKDIAIGAEKVYFDGATLQEVSSDHERHNFTSVETIARTDLSKIVDSGMNLARFAERFASDSQNLINNLRYKIKALNKGTSNKDNEGMTEQDINGFKNMCVALVNIIKTIEGSIRKCVIFEQNLTYYPLASLASSASELAGSVNAVK